MTVNEIETEVRRLLLDAEEPYRWKSAEMRDALQLGVDALTSIRPETRYVNGLLVDRIELPSADAEDQALPVNIRFKEALVYYVCYKCYLDDSSDTANQGLAESYLAKFNSKAQL